METNRKRVRKDFAPLTLSVSLACATQFSPVTQVFNAASGEYEPDRSISPTVLQPTIIANANDGSWPNHNANEHLANMVWKVNGIDITTIAEWAGKYTIDTVGATRGAITIYKNVLPGERFSLHFEADLVDNRLGALHPIVTDPIVLSTVDKAEDSYSMSIGESNAIYYNPFLDKRYLYDYKVAHGFQVASAAEKAAATDKNAYLRSIPVYLYKGGTRITTGFTLKLYRVNSVNSLTEMSTDDVEVVAIDNTEIELDLRIIPKENYMIKAFVGGTEVARIQFSVSRVLQSFHCSPANETDIPPEQTQRYDVAQVDSEGKIIEYPEAIIAIVWYTHTATKTHLRHNEGGHTLFDLNNTGIGNTYQDDWLEVATDARIKEAHSIASDGDGNIFTDENGNILIFN